MSQPYSATEIALGCPVLLLAQEFDMLTRQQKHIMQGQDEAMIGVVLASSGNQAVTARDAQFYSRRRFKDASHSEERSSKITPLEYTQLDGEYDIHVTDLDITTSSIGAMLLANVAPITHTDDSVSNGYLVYQSFPPDDPRLTRTGFLGRHDSRGMGPVVVRLNGNRYVVEVKGCGHADGGFETIMDSFFESVVLGGLPYAAAQREANNMRRAHEAGQTPMLPFATGRIKLQSDAADEYGELGVVFRLTPSTQRLSFANTSHTIPVESIEDSYVVLSKIVDNFINKFFQLPEAPVFISPASHLENYLVTENLTITETDFEDFRDFGSGDFPFVHTQTATFVDTRLAIEHYFTNFSRIDGFDEVNGHRVMAAMLERRLQAHGVVLDFSNCTNVRELAWKVWDDWLVHESHTARIEQEYIPRDITEFFLRNTQKANELLPAISDDACRKLDEAYEYVHADDTHMHLRSLVSSLSIFAHVYSYEGIPNKQRYDALRAQYEVVHNKLKGALAQQDGMILPPTVRDAVNISLQQYEFTARLYGSMKFLQEWLASEHADAKLLLVSGRRELRDFYRFLTGASRMVSSIMNSTDYGGCIEFFRDYLPDFVDDVANAFDDTYGKD